MGKLIKFTEDVMNKVREMFEKELSEAKLANGKFQFTFSAENKDEKAILYFTEMAYLKMTTLVREFDKEVGWHGIAKRGDDPEKNEYFIEDIIVYPQEVTGATVNTNQQEYQDWLYALEDEQFNNLRMQGHSHVNMSTSPSGVDETLYEKFLDQLDDQDFYIFLIWNKRGEKTIKIYDMAKNMYFDTSSCEVKVLDDGSGYYKFIADAKELVKNRPAQTTAVSVATSPAKPSQSQSYSYSHGGYSGANSGYAGSSGSKKPNWWSEFYDEYSYGEGWWKR